MMRSKVALYCIPLLVSIALPAAGERPSLNSLNTQLNRTRDAICAKADADGDTYRPFVCEPRCDCFSPELIETASSCKENGPGSYQIAFSTPATCGGGTCSSSSGSFCSQFFPCPGGETCVTTCNFGICVSSCRYSCSVDGDCPPHGTLGLLTGVGAPDSPEPAQCTAYTASTPGTLVPINSNDAHECLDQVEAMAGQCQ